MPRWISGEISAALNRLIEDGFVRPIVGARFAMEQTAEALLTLDRRQALGKIVLEVR